MKLLLMIQGLYFLFTGLWSLLHLQSFEQVTGPKTDHWLVQTVGVLVGCSGLVFLVAGYNEHLTAEVMLLAFTNALGLAFIDFYFVICGRISRVYLVDGWIQSLFMIVWIYMLSSIPAKT